MNEASRRRNWSRLVALIGIVALLMAACGAPEEATPTTSSPPTTGVPSVRMPVPSEAASPPITATPELVDAVAGDLEVSTRDVTVVADDGVVWPDSGLGCPEPDVSYTPATVPGKRVVLEIDGITYTYHSSLEGGFFLCTKPLPPSSIGSTTMPPSDLNTTADAVSALAARLGVEESAVIVVAQENVTWPDGAIGCPRVGMAYTQALVDGRRVILSVDGVQYHYHGAGTRPLFYCATPSPPAQGGFGDS